MAIAEERLPVGDLTTLSNVVEDDMLLTQTSGANGDVMLTPIAAIISEILTPIFAKLDSPEFIGEPTAPEIADTTTDDARLATTSFVQAVAQLKANLNSPEFTGLAHFAENIPTTVNGDGETVEMATQDDVAALTETIQSLSNSISQLTTAVNALNTVTSITPVIVTDCNNATNPRIIYYMNNDAGNKNRPIENWCIIRCLFLNGNPASGNSWSCAQLGMPMNASTPDLYIRAKAVNGSWGTWRKISHS